MSPWGASKGRQWTFQAEGELKVSLEKGQKYRGNATSFTFAILSDVFKGPDGTDYVAYADSVTDDVEITQASAFENASDFTLIREPKFKVGDRVKGTYGPKREVVSVSSEADSDGLFWYVAKSDCGVFNCYDESEIEPA